MSGVLAGALAGLCQVVVTNPMEIVKIQLQTASQRTSSENVNMVSVVRRLGLHGLYRGTPITLARDVPFSILFFPLQAKLARTWTPPEQRNRHLVSCFGLV